MIPHIIHSCWFGRGKKNALFEECMESQRRFAHDNGWTLREMNEDTMSPELMATPFMRGVLARGEWVKATVPGRYSALAEYGGVYLDCDVEIVGPFGLYTLCGTLPFFAGWEDTHHICDAVLGSVPAAHPGGETIKSLLAGLSLDTPGDRGPHEYGPTYLTRRLRDELRDVSNVQPPDVFYPSHWRTPDEVNTTARTVTVHRWAGTWTSKPRAT